MTFCIKLVKVLTIWRWSIAISKNQNLPKFQTWHNSKNDYKIAIKQHDYNNSYKNCSTYFAIKLRHFEKMINKWQKVLIFYKHLPTYLGSMDNHNFGKAGWWISPWRTLQLKNLKKFMIEGDSDIFVKFTKIYKYEHLMLIDGRL